MTGTSSDLTTTVVATALTGASDIITLDLDGVTAGTFTANGAVETIVVNSNGSVENVLTNIVATSATTLSISGSAAFENTGPLAANFTTIDARNVATADIDSAGAGTVLTGAGDDKVDLDGALATTTLISMGEGNDTLELDTSTGGGAAVLKSVENIKTTDASHNELNLANADQAVNIDIAGGATQLTITNLKTGSTVIASEALNDTNGTAIGFANTAENTVLNFDLQKGDSGAGGAAVFTNIGDLTITTGGATAFASVALDETSTAGNGVNTTKFTLTNTGTGAVGTGDFTQADDVTDFTINNTGSGAVTVGTLVDAEKLTNLTINATGGTVAMGAFGGTTASASLTSVDINAGKNVTIGAINAANAGGITTVSIDATGGTVSNAGSNITNIGGNIGTATLTGSKDIDIDLITATSGRVETVDASATTGNVTLVVTNATTSAGDGTTVTLGNASAGNANTLTLNSALNDNVTGGSGADTVVIAGDAANHEQGTNTVNLGSGNDTLSFAGNTIGKIINMGSSSQYLNGKTAANANADEIVAAGKAYDLGTDGNIELTSDDATTGTTTFSGVESVVGSDGNDIIFGGSSGNTITGGKGTDAITTGAGDDVVVFGASASELVNYAGTDTDGTNIDSITDFTAGTDKIQITNGVTFANLTMATTTGFTVTNGGALAADLASITELATAMQTASAGVASTAGAASATTGLQVYLFTTASAAGGNDGFDGKTYLVINDDTAAIAATDVIIDITGVTGTITASDFQIA